MSRFHEGELAVQEREGVASQARRIGESLGDTFPPLARSFLEQQRMLVVASRNPSTQQVWNSLFTGPAGFASVVDEASLRVRGLPPPEDPFHRNVGSGDLLGVLGIELATRRRMKAKGRVELSGEGFLLRPQLVYSLCPKYIQSRAIEPGQHGAAPIRTSSADALNEAQQAWIEGADTAFFASHHERTGPDASHRGGNPGFVRVVSARRLAFGDYAGNNMFNTLGNLELDPHAGLLFLDFEGGRTLQLTGTARATWDPEELARHRGARRVVSFDVAEVRETSAANPLRFRFLERSRFNP